MKTMRLVLQFMLVCGVLCVAGMLPLQADELQCGMAVVDITPPQGMRMSGYFSERFNTETLDPLLAKAIVFEQDGEAAGLVFCDLIGIAPQVSRAARQRIAEQLPIPFEHVAVSATHSHTGPLYAGLMRHHFHQRAIEEYGSDPHEPIDYAAALVEALVEAVTTAWERRQPVMLRSGFGEERRISFNRRFHMRDGSVRFNPGPLNPDIIEAAGPIDPEIGMIQVETATGEPLGMLISFALHLDTVGGTAYSADYPRVLQDRLAAEFGEGFISLFGAGTCGDINHIDVTTRDRRSTSEIGNLLADSVLAGSQALTEIDMLRLGVRSAIVDAPKQSYSETEIAQAAELLQRVGDGSVPFLDRVRAYSISDLQFWEGETIPLEVQVFRLSDSTAVVTLPGEVFVELGLAIKEGSPFPTTLVIELTNDAPGYIPTRKAFVEGSYETVNSRVVPGSGEEMVETALRLLQDLHGE